VYAASTSCTSSFEQGASMGHACNRGCCDVSGISGSDRAFIIVGSSFPGKPPLGRGADREDEIIRQPFARRPPNMPMPLVSVLTAAKVETLDADSQAATTAQTSRLHLQN
jgi:hypothetical protein